MSLSDKQLAATVADGGRLRALVLELWQRTRMDWGFVTDRLATQASTSRSSRRRTSPSATGATFSSSGHR